MENTTIYSLLKQHSTISNKSAHTVSQLLGTELRKAVKQAASQAVLAARAEFIENPPQKLVNDIIKSMHQKPMTPDERATAVLALIDARLFDQTITAAEIAQLKDIANLRPKERDISIEIVDHSKMPDAKVIRIAEKIMLRLANRGKDASSN